MADDPRKPPPTEYEFTLQIITPDGQTVYTVEAAQLAQIASTQSIQGADQDAQELVSLEAPIAHKRYPEEAKLFGTFLINLSAYNPPRK